MGSFFSLLNEYVDESSDGSVINEYDDIVDQESSDSDYEDPNDDSGDLGDLGDSDGFDEFGDSHQLAQ